MKNKKKDIVNDTWYVVFNEMVPGEDDLIIQWLWSLPKDKRNEIVLEFIEQGLRKDGIIE
jgi:hypothetical protein